MTMVNTVLVIKGMPVMQEVGKHLFLNLHHAGYIRTQISAIVSNVVLVSSAWRVGSPTGSAGCHPLHRRLNSED